MDGSSVVSLVGVTIAAASAYAAFRAASATRVAATATQDATTQTRDAAVAQLLAQFLWRYESPDVHRALVYLSGKKAQDAATIKRDYLHYRTTDKPTHEREVDAMKQITGLYFAALYLHEGRYVPLSFVAVLAERPGYRLLHDVARPICEGHAEAEGMDAPDQFDRLLALVPL